MICFINVDHIGSSTFYNVEFEYNGSSYVFDGYSSDAQITEVQDEQGLCLLYDIAGLLNEDAFEASYTDGAITIDWGLSASGAGPTTSTNTGYQSGIGIWSYS